MELLFLPYLKSKIAEFVKSLFSSSRLAVMMTPIVFLALFSCASNTITDHKSQTNEYSQDKTTPEAELTKTSQNHPAYKGEVILLRGLINIFSRGMNVIGKRLEAKGLKVHVHNHSTWKKIAADIIKRAKQKKLSYPIIIMGHSLGANASVQMASYLGKRGVPISLVIAFDTTITTFVGSNVKETINYYIPSGKNTVQSGPGFNGKISNIDVSEISDISHINVEKSMKLQNQSIQAVMKLLKTKKKNK